MEDRKSQDNADLKELGAKLLFENANIPSITTSKPATPAAEFLQPNIQLKQQL